MIDAFARGTGTGFIIEGRRLLTNAHLVGDQRFLEVQKSGDARRYRATVRFVAHDCDLAMLDVQSAFLANQAMNWLVSGNSPKRGGNRHPNIQPQDVFPCADGFVALAVGNDGQYAKLYEVLGVPALRDERFARNAGRVRQRDDLNATLAKAFLEWNRADLLTALENAGVPSGPINSIPDALADPQIAHRGMLVDIPLT